MTFFMKTERGWMIRRMMTSEMEGMKETAQISAIRAYACCTVQS